MTISSVHQLQNGKLPKSQSQLDRYGAKFMHGIKKTPPQQYVQIHKTGLLYMSFCLLGKELHFKVLEDVIVNPFCEFLDVVLFG